MAKLSKEITVPINDLMKRTTVKVNFSHIKELRIRIWIAEKLIRLACWIMKSTVEISKTTTLKEGK